MKRMFDFACECGQRTEALVVYETTEVPCGCGGTASRVMSAPTFNLEGWSGHFPSSWMKFDKKHRDKLAAERKANS